MRETSRFSKSAAGFPRQAASIGLRTESRPKDEQGDRSEKVSSSHLKRLGRIIPWLLRSAASVCCRGSCYLAHPAFAELFDDAAVRHGLANHRQGDCTVVQIANSNKPAHQLTDRSTTKPLIAPAISQSGVGRARMWLTRGRFGWGGRGRRVLQGLPSARGALVWGQGDKGPGQPQGRALGRR